MKPYAVAAGAALVLLSIAGVVFLIAIESDTNRSYGSGGTSSSSGRDPDDGPVEPGGDSSNGRGAGDEGDDIDPELREALALLGEEGDLDLDAPDDGRPTPLPGGDCELVVVLMDPSGQPRDGVTATLLAGLAREVRTSDGDGICVFGELAPGSYTLRLKAPDTPELEAARAVALESGELRELRLTLPPFDLAISGRVLDQDGKPVPGIVVEARKYLLRPTDTDLVLTRRVRHTVTTDADGNYEIRGLEPAEFLLSTQKTEVYASVRQVFRSGIASADLHLATTQRLEIVGRILDQRGLPIEGARVVPLGSYGASTLSDARGEYRLRLEVSGRDATSVLKVSRPGFRDARVNVSLEEIDPLEPRVVDVRLESVGATAVVVGRVLDEAGTPVGGEAVHLYSGELKARYQVTSEADGTFRFEAVQLADDYKLWLFPRSSYEDFSLESVEVPAEGLELEIPLEHVATGTVRGTMVDPLGRPVPGFVFWLRSTKAQGRSLSVTGDEEGRFEVQDVTAGKLVFETRSMPRFTVKGFVLEPESELDATLVLDWGDAILAGTVLTPEGAPLGGAKVNLLWTHEKDGQQSVSFRHTVTDANGRFSFSELSAGVHRIHVVASDYRGTQVTHDVGNDPTEPLIRLTRGK